MMLGIQPLFWLVYILVPMVLLLLFALYKPRLSILTVPVCAILDFVFFLKDFLYYEGTIIMLIFTAVQAVVVSALALGIIKFRRQMH